MRVFTEVIGLNNVGLLVEVTGKVTWTGQGCFYLDDGSEIDDFEQPDVTNGMPPGVKVALPDGAVLPDVGSYVSVTAISSCNGSGSNAMRVLRVWRSDDVEIVK